MDRIRPTDTTEEKIENLTDPEALAIFREAFYAEAKALEEEALAHPVEVDEERKEALRRRILQSVAAEVEDAEALEKGPEGVPEKKEAAETPMFEDTSSAEMPERKYSMEASEEIVPEGMSKKNTAAGTSKKVYSMGSSAAADSEEASAKAYPADTKREKRRFSPFVRWAAVLVLACVGVLGVSMTSQAKGNGLWSSIQRLIGVETRWENENNGEDRTYTNPEEEKAISEIEDKLGIHVPEFFWWPGKLKYDNGGIVDNDHGFFMTYQDDQRSVYFEGYCDGYDISMIKVWDGEGDTLFREYDGVSYAVSIIQNDDNEIWHNVTWTIDNTRFVLSGVINEEELENILKNIKN